MLGVVGLRVFYAQPLGHVARRLVDAAIRTRWPDTRGLAVLGLAYAPPSPGLFRHEVERTFAFMPAALGVVKWPSAAPTLAALVDETYLPLPDAAVDRVVAVHALEMTANGLAMLEEVWRGVGGRGRRPLLVPRPRGRVGWEGAH